MTLPDTVHNSGVFNSQLILPSFLHINSISIKSLRMLDNFLSRTLHHVMGPLHALRSTCEIVSDRLQTHKVDEAEVERNVDLLERAVDTISGSTRMIADVSDLARFGECTTRMKLQ